MATTEHRKILDQYSILMSEVKHRILAIDRLLNTKTGFPFAVAEEFCYLQLRMICECIALGCLVAHGNFKATQSNKLRRAYSATALMKALAKLNPDFYPQRMVRGPENVMAPIAVPTFSRDELEDLYGRSHRRLHRGNVENIMAVRGSVDDVFSEILKWIQKIIDMLGKHIILLDRKPGLAIFCQMGPIRQPMSVVTQLYAWPERAKPQHSN